MDRRVGNYLVQYQPPVLVRAVPKQSLFIAETRLSYFLEHVIHNAVGEFPEWDLYVCAPPPVLDALRPMFPQMKEIAVNLPPRCSPETFSAIMFSPEIWQVFETEYVMIIQTDTVFAPGAASRLPDMTKDYYGAACGDLSSDAAFVINGGLSLRRVSAFARAAAKLTDADRQLPEDVAYCQVMRRYPSEFVLPSMAECMHFAIESFGDPSAAVGIHGTDKYYAPPVLFAAMLGQRKRTIVDCFMYDGEPILEQRLKILGQCVDRFVVVEARFTHAGAPKELQFNPARWGRWAHKIKYVVVDSCPPAPEGFGDCLPWVKDNMDAWWREKFQRDSLKSALEDFGTDALVIVSDVDEIPNPAVLEDVDVSEGPVHLDMAFLVHKPTWQKHESWSRAFACSRGHLDAASPTDIRCSQPTRVVKNAGWHCSSFFDVERQVQKVARFAHREFAGETNPDVIRARFELGKDPYGRGGQFDCFHTIEHAWLHFLLKTFLHTL